MKAIQTIYEGGQIRPIEPVPDVKSASVLVIFLDVSEGKGEEEPSPTDLEAKLFGAGVDLWTDEVDAAVRQSCQTLLSWFEAGKLKPHVSHTLDLADAGRALTLLAERKATGKVVLTTGR